MFFGDAECEGRMEKSDGTKAKKEKGEGSKIKDIIYFIFNSL